MGAAELTDGVLLGQDVERKRIAHELHDDIGQRLALVGVDDTHKLRSSRLGLVSIRERVRRVGGDIVIASAPRRGVTVTVRVPLAAASGADRMYAHPAARV